MLVWLLASSKDQYLELERMLLSLRTYVEYSEEDEKCIDDEGANVGECCKRECHFFRLIGKQLK